MPAESKKDAYVGLGVGILMATGGLLFRLDESTGGQAPEVGNMIIIVGVLFLIWGCISFFKGKQTKQ